MIMMLGNERKKKKGEGTALLMGRLCDVVKCYNLSRREFRWD